MASFKPPIWRLAFPEYGGLSGHSTATLVLLVAKYIDREDAGGGARGDPRGGDADGEGGGGDPDGVERVGLERDERDGIDLRVERDQAVGACGPGDRVAGHQSRDGADYPYGESLQDENVAHLIAVGAERHQHGDVARAIGDRHGQHDRMFTPAAG